MGHPGPCPLLPEARVVLAPDPVRQERDRAVGPGLPDRHADARAAGGGHPRGHERHRLRASRPVRHVGGRRDVRSLRGLISGAHPRARPVFNVAQGSTRDRRPGPARGHGGRSARPDREGVGAGERRRRAVGPEFARGRCHGRGVPPARQGERESRLGSAHDGGRLSGGLGGNAPGPPRPHPRPAPVRRSGGLR